MTAFDTAALATDRVVPDWVITLSWLVLAGTFVGFGLVPMLSPGTAFPDAGAGGEFPVRFLAIRHLAFAAPLLHGILSRNHTILATMYGIFVPMAVLDAITLGVAGYPLPYLNGVTGWAAAGVAAVVFVAPMLAVARALRRT